MWCVNLPIMEVYVVTGFNYARRPASGGIGEKRYVSTMRKDNTFTWSLYVEPFLVTCFVIPCFKIEVLTKTCSVQCLMVLNPGIFSVHPFNLYQNSHDFYHILLIPTHWSDKDVAYVVFKCTWYNMPDKLHGNINNPIIQIKY